MLTPPKRTGNHFTSLSINAEATASLPLQALSWRRSLNKLPSIPNKAQGPGGKKGTVASAIAVLRLLADAKHPLGVNAIARELSLAPSSCFKILKSLLAEEFVELDPRTKAYSLGSGAIIVARRALDPTEAFTTVRSRLEETAQTYSIAIGLWRLVPRSRMILIGFVDGNSQMRIHMSIGQRVPMLIGAIGRAIAARLNLTKEQLQQEFELLRWQTPLSFSDYLTQVEQAKRVGYGLDEGNFAPGVTTVAVSIVDQSETVCYGISGIMFSGQHDDAMLHQIAQELIAVSQWASPRLVSRPLL